MNAVAALISETPVIALRAAASTRQGTWLTLLTGLSGVVASVVLIWSAAACPDAAIVGDTLNGPRGLSAAPASGRTMGATAGVHFHDASAILREGRVDNLSNIGELIRRVNAGEPGAQDALFAAAYGELRKLARSRLHDGGRNTVLDTTALVHESYLRFIQGGQLRSDDRRAFFAYASRVMRSVIIDAVRERQAERRGGDLQRLTLNTQLIDKLPSGEDEVLKVHEALDALAQAEPRLAQVVEMRYFGGYSEQEVAEVLGLTDRTVRRDWEKARLLLGAMLQG